MITKNTLKLAIVIALSITTLNAGLVNPFSSCNIKQAQIMTNKCDKLSGKVKDYTQCEAETLKDFFKCLEVEKRAGGKK